MSNALSCALLAGRRVLIVEDRFFVADEIRQICLDQGGEVAGPTGRVAVALSLAGGETLDLAILDVDLRGDDVFEVAGVLEARGIPFLFVTGHRATSLPERFRCRPIVQKPFSDADLLAGIQRIVEDTSVSNSMAK